MIFFTEIQGDQLNMAVCFWYLVKIVFSSVHVNISVHWTSHFLKGTRKTLPCLSGQVVPCRSSHKSLFSAENSQKRMEVMKSQYENKLLVSIFIYSVPLIVFRSRRQVNKILRTYLFGENPRMIEAFCIANKLILSKRLGYDFFSKFIFQNIFKI